MFLPQKESFPSNWNKNKIDSWKSKKRRNHDLWNWWQFKKAKAKAKTKAKAKAKSIMCLPSKNHFKFKKPNGNHKEERRKEEQRFERKESYEKVT